MLSHGDPVGAVHSDDDALVVSIQTDVMALYCLAELFFLALGDEEAALQAAKTQAAISQLYYRLGRYNRPKDSKGEPEDDSNLNEPAK